MVMALITEFVVTPRLTVLGVTELLDPTGVLFKLAFGAIIKLVIPVASIKQKHRQIRNRWQ